MTAAILALAAAGLGYAPNRCVANEAASALPILCMVFREPAQGLDPMQLREGLVLEQRKTGLVFNQAVVQAPEACPGRGTASGAVVIVSGAMVSFDGPEGTVDPFDAARAPPFDRPQAVARWMVALFDAQLRGERVPVVDFPFARDAPTPVAKRRLWWTAEAGGLYEYQPGPGLHTGSIEVVGGLGLYDEMLWTGLKLGYQPATQLPSSSLDAMVQAVAFSVQVKGGLSVDPVLLRLGFGVGLEWRRLEFGQAVVAAQRVQSSVLPVLEGEVGLTVRLPENMRLTVAGTVRGFLKGDGFTMQGLTDYDPPRYSVGTVLRIGIVFPRQYAMPGR